MGSGRPAKVNITLSVLGCNFDGACMCPAHYYFIQKKEQDRAISKILSQNPTSMGKLVK